MNFSNEQQIAIRQSQLGNIYIAAGPGSGKSTTLAEIARQLSGPDKSIMLITFTNKSAKDIIGKVGDKSMVGGTFHSIIYRIMRDNNHDFSICDEGKKKLIIRRLFNCRKDKEAFDKIYESISVAKSVYPIKDCKYTARYNAELARYSMMDFDDIINHGIDFLKKNKPSINVTDILVDELQDTSQNQLELLKELHRLTDAHIVGVGDLDQSIYEFRGARPRNVKDFIDHFGCNVYELGLNFRSKSNIVTHSRKLIENNKDRIQKDLRASDGGRGVVNVYRCSDTYKEIDYVVRLCRRKRREDVAILYRNRLHKMKLEYELRKNNIKYKVNDSTEITDRSAFRVILSIMKIASGAYDVYDVSEAAKGMKSLGNVTVNKIKELSESSNDILNDIISDKAKDDKRFAKSVSNIIKIQEEFTKYKGAKLSDMVRVIEGYLIKSFDVPKDIYSFLIDITNDYVVSIGDVRDLCNDFGLINTDEEQDDKDATIELSTIHGYKGGEKDIVIIPFSNWDIRPDPKIKDIWQAERRLWYVAVTRPKKELYISYSGYVKPKFIKEMGL